MGHLHVHWSELNIKCTLKGKMPLDLKNGYTTPWFVE